MTALDDDLAAMRNRLTAALHDQPRVRDTLSLPEIVAAVDVAMATAGLPQTVGALAAANAVVAAIADDPPPGTETLVDDYTAAKPGAQEHYPTAVP